MMLTIQALAIASSPLIQRLQDASGGSYLNWLGDLVVDAITHPIPWTGQDMSDVDNGAAVHYSSFGEIMGGFCVHTSTKFCLIGAATGCIC